MNSKFPLCRSLGLETVDVTSRMINPYFVIDAAEVERLFEKCQQTTMWGDFFLLVPIISPFKRERKRELSEDEVRAILRGISLFKESGE
jgi:hypothetical protein